MADKDKGGNVRVVVRFRPQSEAEIMNGGLMITSFEGTGKSVTVDGQRKAAFTFDRVFDPESRQEEIYNYAAKPVVEDVLKGYNGTIFAYGQTSSGKTHTMEGPDMDGNDRGIIPRIVQNIFQYIELAPDTLEFTVRVSYFEIYMERIRDLLCDGNDNLQIHENRERGVYVRHATELFMQDTEEVMEVMRSGALRRSVASTNMNDISSRSHSVFVMEITQKDTIKGGVKSGRLYLVDLAGSEKVSKTGADGEVLEEAKNINKSLSALGLVIMSLTDGQPRHHVPYRDSKLTRILQESLGGNSRTTIIICASPSSYNEQETLSSLRFGKRAKNIKNNAVVNIQYSAEELQKQLDVAKKEIARMSKLLAAAEAELQLWRSGVSVSEESRIALSNSAGAASEAGAGGDEQAAGGSAMSEQEREEVLRREAELLDMLDDKDEQIRILERELEILSKDKAVITTLAGENNALRTKVKELEEQNDDFLAETTEYEVTIEDMARTNQELNDLAEKAQKEKEALELALREQMQQYERTVTSVAEGIGLLAQGKAARAEGNSQVDVQLAKARVFVQGLQSDLAQAKKSNTDAEHETARLKENVEKAQRDLSELRFAMSQVENREREAQDKLAATQQKHDDLRSDKGRLEAQNSELTEKLMALQNELQRTKVQAGAEADKGQAQVEEIRLMLERQKESQKQQHSEQIAALQAQIDAAQKEKYALAEEKGRLALQVDQLRMEIDKKTDLLTSATEKLEIHQKKQQQDQTARQETQALTEQTSRQLDTCEAVKAKWRESLLGKLKRINEPGAATAGGAASTSVFAVEKAPATSAYIASLEKTNKELQQNLQEAQRTLAQTQRESGSSEKQLQAKNERIKNLEALLKGSEERLQKFMDVQQQIAETRRNVERSQQRNVIRKKSAKPGGAAAPAAVVRGGSKAAVTDSAKSEFWKEQASGAGPATPGGGAAAVKGGARPVIVNQGQPLVGKYASPAPATPTRQEPPSLMSVEFV